VRENGGYEGFRNAMNGVINALTSPPGRIPWGPIYRAVRGSGNNVRMVPLTALFTLSTQS
jgi:hypothetical protein